MIHSRLAFLTGLILLAGCSETPTSITPPAALRQGPAIGPNLVRLDGELVRIHPVRGTRAASPAGIQALGMIYHGGPIMNAPKVAAMYWGSAPIYSGGPAAGSTGTGAQDGSLIGHFLRNVGGTPHWNINTTYTDTVTGGHTVPNSLGYTQFWANNINVPPSNGTPVTSKQIRTALFSGFTSGKLTYSPGTIYVIFSAGRTNLGGGFGSQYCAYHSVFNFNGQRVIYAVLPFNNAARAGCTFRQLSPNGDQAADDEMASLVHEVEESATDPYLNAWFDAQGSENADKCSNVTGPLYTTPNGGKANVNFGGKDFLVQQNWVNLVTGAGCVTHFP